jgi:hypothetical protein
MKRVDYFGLMKAALVNYVGFHNIWQNPNSFRPISDLDDLYAELDKAGDFGEIGADQRRPPGHASGRFTEYFSNWQDQCGFVAIRPTLL